MRIALRTGVHGDDTCARTNKKYAFANRVNCSNKKRGIKLYHVYFDLQARANEGVAVNILLQPGEGNVDA